MVLLVAAVPARATDTATANDMARFLAGLQPAANSPLAPFTREGTWQQHARYFDNAWKGLDSRQLSRIRQWSSENLSVRQPTTFYMFSGPDFLYADAFFPGSATYVMSGLEPVGRIPEMKHISRRTLPGVLGHLRASTGSVLRISFFLTNQMRAQLRYAQLNGTLPILYTFLARSGKTITGVELVKLDPDGSVKPSDGEPVKGVPNGVKIAFTSADGKPQTLYYFSTDVSNGGIKSSGFLKFCEGLGKGDAFVKSASYLMHNDSFSTVREFLLAHSATIVQDDTGVPVRFFKPERMGAAPVRPLPGAHPALRRPLSAAALRHLPLAARQADRLRRRLSLAAQRVRTCCSPCTSSAGRRSSAPPARPAGGPLFDLDLRRLDQLGHLLGSPPRGTPRSPRGSGSRARCRRAAASPSSPAAWTA